MNVILACSATGGHIYPALAIAEKISRKDPEGKILFIVTPSETFADSVAEYGYEVAYIDVRGIRRKKIIENLRLIKDMAISSKQIKGIFKGFNPDLVIGTGGYVSGYVVRAACKAGIPAFLHEQNVVPGLSNRLSERYVKKVFVAFPECREHFKDKDKVVFSGNPVRRAFITAGAADYRGKMGISPKATVLLAFGGSQGAERLNEAMTEALDILQDEEHLEVFFITGRYLYESAMERLSAAGLDRKPNYHVMDYCENIHEYYAAADLIIGRSGAITVSEIAVCGKASILVPSPNVTGDHQYFNAKTLADKGAAIIIREEGLTGRRLADEVKRLMRNKATLNRMSEAAAAQGRIDVTDVIYDHIKGFE